MTQTFALTIAGSVLATLAVLLLAVRLGPVNRRLLAYARRFPDAHGSLALVILPAAAAALCFAALAPANQRQTGSAAVEETGSIDEPAKAEALASLRAYADRVAAKKQVIDNMSVPAGQEASGTGDVADVETMIQRLAARLEKDPGDVKGWKMLGWAYLNTARPAEAAKAYETALKLAPDDAEIKQALEAAKMPSAQLATTSASTAREPGTDDLKSAESLSDDQKSSMIRGMVDRLASRLQMSPQDEEGWIRLMRARMVLGEKDAAKAALTKALETFSADASAKERLSASARELGVESN